MYCIPTIQLTVKSWYKLKLYFTLNVFVCLKFRKLVVFDLLYIIFFSDVYNNTINSHKFETSTEYLSTLSFAVCCYSLESHGIDINTVCNKSYYSSSTM